ncbi:unnamed protein product [Mytilus coruscus]|uniref:Cysteine and tyrosine-rich protein 1 n=1 Tax=Mytilus coruscus TaxID=42192 RepID=A0A6J8F592_MYTCO|nr:unnamed protein product [Mytilus coruscus]
MIGFIFAFQSLLGLANAGTTCYYYNSLGSKIYQKYCSSGCCYLDSHDPCCPYYYNNYYTLSGTYIPYSLTVGAIVGIIIGVLGAIGLIVGVSVCLYCACCRTSPATGGLVITNTQPPVSYSGTSNTASVLGNTQPYGFHDNSGSSMGTSGIGNTTRGST